MSGGTILSATGARIISAAAEASPALVTLALFGSVMPQRRNVWSRGGGYPGTWPRETARTAAGLAADSKSQASAVWRPQDSKCTTGLPGPSAGNIRSSTLQHDCFAAATNE